MMFLFKESTTLYEEYAETSVMRRFHDINGCYFQYQPVVKHWTILISKNVATTVPQWATGKKLACCELRQGLSLRWENKFELIF